VAENDRLAAIEETLNTIVKLLSLLLADGKVQREQIRTLGVAGLGRSDIAELLGTTPGTVSVELSKMKRKALAGAGRNTSKLRNVQEEQ
jgi:hypothetical protein